MKLEVDKLCFQLREALESYGTPSYLDLFSVILTLRSAPKIFYQPYQSNESSSQRYGVFHGKFCGEFLICLIIAQKQHLFMAMGYCWMNTK